MRPPPAERIVLVLAALVAVSVTLAEPGTLHHATVMGAIVIAALVSSIAGFAFSAICGAILFQFHDDPVGIVQIMITCSIANQASMTWTMRHNIDWKELTIYLAGGVVGLPAGVWILTTFDRAMYTHALGIFLLAYGGFLLFRKPFTLCWQSRAADFIVGLCGGITGGAAGFPGASLTIWCGMKGWDKARQRAVVQPFILIMQVMALPAISIARHSSVNAVGFDFIDILFVPASLIGTAVGMALFKRMTDLQFARAVNILLIGSGLSFFL